MAKAKKPTAATGGGRRKGKAGSPVELRDNVPDLTDNDGANKLAEAARGMARIASSAAAKFKDPPPSAAAGGILLRDSPAGGHIDLRTVLADHSVT